MAYNEANGITPRTVSKSREDILNQRSILDVRGRQTKAYIEPETPSIAADPLMAYLTRDQIEALIIETEKKMKQAAKDLDFISAALYRDELFELRGRVKSI